MQRHTNLRCTRGAKDWHLLIMMRRRCNQKMKGHGGTATVHGGPLRLSCRTSSSEDSRTRGLRAPPHALVATPTTAQGGAPACPHLRARLGRKGEARALGRVGHDVGNVVVKPVHALRMKTTTQKR